MRDLKIEVDGTVNLTAITWPLASGHVRVVVCSENGAATIDSLPRPATGQA